MQSASTSYVKVPLLIIVFPGAVMNLAIWPRAHALPVHFIIFVFARVLSAVGPDSKPLHFHYIVVEIVSLIILKVLEIGPIVGTLATPLAFPILPDILFPVIIEAFSESLKLAILEEPDVLGC